jgi:hypothetical protein
MNRQLNTSTYKSKDDVTKLYILAKPTKLSDLTLDDIYDPLDSSRGGWKAKARAFRERKERQFHHEF